MVRTTATETGRGTNKTHAALILLLCTAISAMAIGTAIAGELDRPNLTLGPGMARSGLTVKQICIIKWGNDARHMPDSMKLQVFHAYGLSGNQDSRCVPDSHGRRCEIDHLISRELGGADDIRNLSPQPHGTHPWNAQVKDSLENRLHREICSGQTSLTQARREIVTDWTAAYRKRFGALTPD
jgi:hypothetical protein